MTQSRYPYQRERPNGCRATKCAEPLCMHGSPEPTNPDDSRMLYFMFKMEQPTEPHVQYFSFTNRQQAKKWRNCFLKHVDGAVCTDIQSVKTESRQYAEALLT